MSCPADEPIYVIKYLREYGRNRTELGTYTKENSFKQSSRAVEKKERKLLTLLYIFAPRSLFFFCCYVQLTATEIFKKKGKQ